MIASIFLYREQMDDIESKRPESPIATRYWQCFQGFRETWIAAYQLAWDKELMNFAC